jgi:dynein heavy chain
VLGDVQLIKRLIDFDKDNLSDKTVRQLRKYTGDPHYTPDLVAKQSNAARSLCLWTHAMEKYCVVLKQVCHFSYIFV